ncbi:MAG: CHAT domain-containing protein [Saprospiraceae bacterium]
MNQPPVLFFAFANEQGRFLDYLKRESTNIQKALLPIDAKGFIKVVREESTETSDLFRIFQAYRDRMAVFHFAGHAGGQQLNFEDQAVGMRELAQLIAEQKDTLRLVFLNGCATADQVAYLHDLGIPVVVATTCEIEDPKAQIFAARFYAALANHYNLERAFLHAKTYLEVKFQQNMGIYRGIKLAEDRAEANPIPWGLYLAEDAEVETLQWKLPQYYSVPPPSSMQVSYAVNKNILRLLEAVKRKAPHLSQKIYPTEEAFLITSFPWVISVHLFRLFADAESMSVAGLPRLRELIQAYVSTTRFLAYIGLAQLWNEIKSGTLILSQELETFFLLGESNSQNYDYLLLLQRICEKLESPAVKWFFPDLKSIAERIIPGNVAFDHYRFLESTRQRLSTENIHADEVKELCYLCESVLTDLLVQAADLVNFSLLTVKDIRIINPGRIAVANPFEHMIGDLHVPFQTYLKHRPRSLEDYINSHSVLLTRRSEEKHRIQEYLNLSPFYLDKTAFGESRGKNTPMIYALQYLGNGSYVYQNVSYNINRASQNGSSNSIDVLTIQPDMEDYQLIQEEVDTFLQDISA